MSTSLWCSGSDQGPPIRVPILRIRYIVGGAISPLLLNVALHRMEEALHVTRDCRGRIVSPCAVVRYADDFVVACTTKDAAEQAIAHLSPWLARRGLALSHKKTRIVHIADGFDFLGFTVRQHNAPATKKQGRVLLITPSHESVRTLRARLRAEWIALRGVSVRAVPQHLNPLIRGWAHYFRAGNASHTFRALDNWMFRREVQYVRYMNPGKGTAWTKQRYWGLTHRDGKDHWVFGDKETGVKLVKFRWYPMRHHVLVTGTNSPDDPTLRTYWHERQRHLARVLTPSDQRIAHRQHYTCEVCGESLFNGEETHVHHIRPRAQGGMDCYANLTFRHMYCHQQSHAERYDMEGRGQL